jgi:predicted small integral membrane protein
MGKSGVDKINPGMLIRLCKACLVAAMALLLGLVAFNNIVDYGDNWAFVQHVMGMDTVFPDSTQRWRAIHSAPVQQLFYLAIIATEALSGGLLMLGAVALFRQARSESGFDRALALPVAGLTVAMLLYGGGFVAVGGEWFLMWQSRSWGGSDAAGRFFLLNAAVLIVLLAGRAPAAVEP